MALTATTYADAVQRHIGNANETLVRTFYASAASSYKKGDFVTIDTAGRVVKNTTDDAIIDGVVASDVDNSLGAADDTMVPVVVKGNVWVDGIFDASTGAFDDPAAIGTQMSVAGDSGTTAAEGQALAAVAGATNKQFTSLSIHAIPAAGTEVVKMLAFFQGSGKYE